jgi:mRNA (2'-O-methyladenosine-N6-)-methyltransferase
VDELAWVKRTVNGKIAKGHGFYLQHAKESCLVGVKVIKIFHIMKGK